MMLYSDIGEVKELKRLFIKLGFELIKILSK
jgi:hypothetical protein